MTTTIPTKTPTQLEREEKARKAYRIYARLMAADPTRAKTVVRDHIMETLGIKSLSGYYSILALGERLEEEARHE